MSFKKLKEELLKDKNFRAEYEKTILPRQVAEMFISARAKLGLTQKELAKLTGTQQPSIARIENMKSMPSLPFLRKTAIAIGAEFVPRFSFVNDTKNVKESIFGQSVYVSSTIFQGPRIDAIDPNTENAVLVFSVVKLKF